MPRWARKTFQGWGRVHSVESLAARPERLQDVPRAFADVDTDSLLAFGAGRSYGDTALNSGGRALVMRRLDRFLDFDPATGLLTAESGVTFAETIDAFLPMGFMCPVVPGTGFATLGGGVANDIHGKNHHQVGSLGQHLEWFDLRLPNGQRRRVSLAADESLFRATVGGVGLTGIIERVCLKLKRVPSDGVQVRKRRIRDLDEYLRAFDEEKSRSHYVVGWIDALARGRRLGRGILETASVAEQGIGRSRRRARRIPIDFPGFMLNSFSVRTFNALYHARVPASGFQRILPYQDFLFPLDALHDWNRIYGKRGFRQFQCVVPFATGRDALKQMLERIAATGRGSFLAVLKAMGQPGLGYLSFPMPGYTLALDFPNSPGVNEFLMDLQRITCDHGGRVYLAKDSTLSADQFRAMYPASREYEQVLATLDPERRMQSDLGRRLGIRNTSNG